MELEFADHQRRKAFACHVCPAAVKKGRKCGEPSFDVLKNMRVDPKRGIGFTFCPGKATWYPLILELYDACRVALETGILPRQGGVEDQSELFGEVFPTFVERWKARTYERIWGDVQAFTEAVLKSLFGKRGG